MLVSTPQGNIEILFFGMPISTRTVFSSGENTIYKSVRVLKILVKSFPSVGCLESCFSIPGTPTQCMIFGFLMERIFEDGALDAYWIPIHMKKNRPGTMVQVLCKAEHKDILIQRLLAETTSLGVRHYPVHRILLARDELTIASSFGQIRVKRVKDPDGNILAVSSG